MSTISPFQYDLYRLAVGILYINLGRAGVEFPTTTKAHPSYTVHVCLIPPNGALRSFHEILFPFQVRWDIWKNIVVPLFADGSILVKLLGGAADGPLRNLLNALMLTDSLESLLDKIARAILDQYEAAGYTPPSIAVQGYVVDEQGSLTYLTDAELKAQAAQIAADARAQSAWANNINNGEPINPWLLRLDADIPQAEPEPVSSTTTYPTVATTTYVVEEPVAPGEPVNRPGTVALGYEQFDV